MNVVPPPGVLTTVTVPLSAATTAETIDTRPELGGLEPPRLSVLREESSREEGLNTRSATPERASCTVVTDVECRPDCGKLGRPPACR
jgi:hypothetical protein